MNYNFEFEEIESCEQVGFFEDEYVYDISVKDTEHQTFFGNDILVHNSLFVTYGPAFKHCDWQSQLLNTEYLESLTSSFIVIYGIGQEPVEFDNDNCMSKVSVNNNHKEDMELIYEALSHNPELVIIDGKWIHTKDREFWERLDGRNVLWNWSAELDFIIGFDKFKYAEYFRNMLDNHAAKYGIDNIQDFELEKVNDGIINIAKKKYIQNIVYEDGMLHDNVSYIFPKGVELVRSSTPAFARDKIVDIVKYLFRKPDTFNIQELLTLVKELRKNFDLSYPNKIDDICMQTSCNKYDEKILNDTTDLEYVDGSHFSIKAAGYHNLLLNKNPKYKNIYDTIKSGDKIKYYYCESTTNEIFAYIRGAFPIEIAPKMDMDMQFSKSILSPINSIIKTVGMPEITSRLKVVVDIFGGLL